MKFKLTLIASTEDGTAAITQADVTIPNDGVSTLGGGLAVILERLKEAGFSVD